MSENSKREQIIEITEQLIKEVPSIKSVLRIMPQYADLQNFAQTQFPVIAIVAKLPVPAEKIETRNGFVDQIISELKIDIFVYLQFKSAMNLNSKSINPKWVDSEISDIADDLFAKLYENQNRNNLVIKTEVKLNEELNVWDPFIAFQLTVIHNYVHSIGGI